MTDHEMADGSSVGTISGSGSSVASSGSGMREDKRSLTQSAPSPKDSPSVPSKNPGGRGLLNSVDWPPPAASGAQSKAQASGSLNRATSTLDSRSEQPEVKVPMAQASFTDPRSVPGAYLGHPPHVQEALMQWQALILQQQRDQALASGFVGQPPSRSEVEARTMHAYLLAERQQQQQLQQQQMLHHLQQQRLQQQQQPNQQQLSVHQLQQQPEQQQQQQQQQPHPELRYPERPQRQEQQQPPSQQLQSQSQTHPELRQPQQSPQQQPLQQISVKRDDKTIDSAAQANVMLPSANSYQQLQQQMQQNQLQQYRFQQYQLQQPFCFQPMLPGVENGRILPGFEQFLSAPFGGYMSPPTTGLSGLRPMESTSGPPMGYDNQFVPRQAPQSTAFAPVMFAPPSRPEEARVTPSVNIDVAKLKPALTEQPKAVQVATYNMHAAPCVTLAHPAPCDFQVKVYLREAQTNREIVNGFLVTSVATVREGAVEFELTGLKLNKMGPIKAELLRNNIRVPPLLCTFEIRVHGGPTLVQSAPFRIVSSCSQLTPEQKQHLRPLKRTASKHVD